MKTRISILLFCVCAVFAIRPAEKIKPPAIPPEAAKALHSSTNTVLYALDGESFYQGTNRDDAFYDEMILGKTKLNPEQAKVAISAFEQAIDAGKRYSAAAHCFNPRHALRVTAEGKTYDFLLCYECGWLSVIHEDKEMVRVVIVGTPEQLNKLLEEVKIPIPK